MVLNRHKAPCHFCDDIGTGAAINGAFTSINGNLKATYTGQAKQINGAWYYQVTIK
jgi:hypothetical protein